MARRELWTVTALAEGVALSKPGGGKVDLSQIKTAILVPKP
jgi:hypothetical protein